MEEHEQQEFLQRIQPLLGLAQRARKLAFGADAVSKSLQRNQAFLVVLATDISANTKTKVLRNSKTKVPFFQLLTKDQLGAAFARKTLGLLAITDLHLAQAVIKKSGFQPQIMESNQSK